MAARKAFTFVRPSRVSMMRVARTSDVVATNDAGGGGGTGVGAGSTAATFVACGGAGRERNGKCEHAVDITTPLITIAVALSLIIPIKVHATGV